MGLDEKLCDKFFTPLKQAGITIIVKASILNDALVAERCGADLVVAKGWEGGGHVTPETTMTLLPQVAEALSIPVIGSGGIVDGRGMAAAISLGAEGIEMGTAFLCSEECTIHENTKNAIINQKDHESVVTFYSIGEPCRQIKNKLADEVIELEADNPVKSVETELRNIFKPCLKNGMHEGDTENGAIMSGMTAPLIKQTRPAAEIIDSTIEGCKEIFERNRKFEF